VSAIIALLTDFGTSDAFVGVLKAVILRQAPQAVIVDLAHDIAPGDVAAAALRLWQAAPWLPPETVCLGVVDPGVGSARRAIAGTAGSLAFVGPDNGIFSWMLARAPGFQAVQLAVPAAASATFHGRDVFAPAAARLCAGAPLDSLGSPVDHLQILPFPRLAVEEKAVRGEVLLHDRFGNALTSIGVLSAGEGSLSVEPWVTGQRKGRLAGTRFHAVLPGGLTVPLARAFSDVPLGSPLAYVGSDGLLEIGVNGGSAAGNLGFPRGSEVVLSAITP